MTVVDTSYVEVAAQDKSSMGIEEPVSQDVVDMTDEEVMKLVGFPLAPAGYEPLFNSWVRMWRDTHGKKPLSIEMHLLLSKLLLVLNDPECTMVANEYLTSVMKIRLDLAIKAEAALSKSTDLADTCVRDLSNRIYIQGHSSDYFKGKYDMACKEYYEHQKKQQEQMELVTKLQNEHTYVETVDRLTSKIEKLLGFDQAETDSVVDSS